MGGGLCDEGITFYEHEKRTNADVFHNVQEKEYYPPPPERYPRHFSPPVDK